MKSKNRNARRILSRLLYKYAKLPWQTCKLLCHLFSITYHGALLVAMTFPIFCRFPKEIREIIWLYSLPPDEPEVCLMWPVNLYERDEGPRGMQPTQPFVVDIGFPAMMHACQESRALVQNTKRSGVRFRSSTAAGCPVPFRRYRPDLDTLYWGSENFQPLIWSGAFEEQLHDVKSVALDIQLCFRHQSYFVDYLQHELDGLQNLSLVLPDSTGRKPDGNGHPDSDGNRHSDKIAFKQPARRCKLRSIPREVQDTIQVTPGFMLYDDRSEPLPLSQALRLARRGIERGITGQDSESPPIHSASPPDHVADEESFLQHVTIIAQTFVEYQKDGTWAEVCGERQFVERGEDTVMSGRYIPVAERPDPEVIRVNDLDGEFDLTYLPTSDDD